MNGFDSTYRSWSLMTRSKAAAEIERLRAGGCARGQITTKFCQQAEELAREVERIRAASQWRPISEATAGDEFLVWNGCRNVAYFNGKSWLWMGESLDPQPTLFQPLPSPPTQEEGE